MGRQPRSHDEADGQWGKEDVYSNHLIIREHKNKNKKTATLLGEKPSSHFNALLFKMINKY